MNKLPRAPLKEVIFELHWRLDVEPDLQQEVDVKYNLAQGRFQDLVLASGFPDYRRKVPVGLPLAVLNHKVEHQFWAGQKEHPVIQLGPGILTVNDTDKNYIWERFYPLVAQCLESLEKAYRQPVQPILFNLRYIDVIRAREYRVAEDWLAFIHDNLKVQVKHLFDTQGQLSDFSFNQSFALENGSELNIIVSKGNDTATNEDLLVWQTGIIQSTSTDWVNILPWLQWAHDLAHQTFLSMTKGNFYDSFRVPNG
ncbi:MAG: TIGR04255 family protein [Saprospiraceae bacterium]|nr:TIGR04255 family protein [Saprospiraceae bacterium]